MNGQSLPEAVEVADRGIEHRRGDNWEERMRAACARFFLRRGLTASPYQEFYARTNAAGYGRVIKVKRSRLRRANGAICREGGRKND